jgi:hypothetical protein
MHSPHSVPRRGRQDHVKKADVLEAVRDGMADAVWRMIRSATSMPGADFYAALEDGVARGIAQLQNGKQTEEARRLLDQLAQAFAAEPHAVEFVRHAVERNANRLVNEHHDHCGIIAFDPPWLLRVSQEILRALKA